MANAIENLFIVLISQLNIYLNYSNSL
uniref:Uncharacterized protein n=1 Tax=Anguilla anguilla TaxID=7936 RepID=A0A0E9R8M3_ANGAN